MEYQKDQDKPYIDPLTGEQFKYHPTTFKFDVADLKAPVFNADANLGRPATDIDLKNYETQIKKTVNEDLPDLEKELKKQQKSLKIIDDKINSGTYRTHALGRLRTDKTNTETKIGRAHV